MKAVNAELFAGQEVFVGMDVHKSSWTVTELYGGNVTKTYSMKPDPLELAKHLNREYPGAKFKSVYEAGFCGFWVHRELIKLGIENIVVNPADIPTSNKEKLYKNDVRDSKKLARELDLDHLVFLRLFFDWLFHIPNQLLAIITDRQINMQKSLT